MAVILLGQSMAYHTSGKGSCISTETDGTVISYDIETGYDTEVSEIHLKNHADAPERYLVLYDPGYGTIVGYNELEPTMYLLSNYLDRCESMEIHTASVAEVTEMVDHSLSSGNYDTGLVMLTGAFPETVYDGTPSSKIVQWMDAGGWLYWSGMQFGRYIADANGCREVPDYASVCSSIFGTDRPFNDGQGNEFAFDYANESLTNTIRIDFNRITYGMDTAAMPGALPLGYTDGQYASVGVIGYGSGNLTVFGGSITFTQIYNMLRMASMGITHLSEVIFQTERMIDHGSIHGSFQDDTDLRHVIILHELKTSRIWVFDRSFDRFI